MSNALSDIALLDAVPLWWSDAKALLHLFRPFYHQIDQLFVDPEVPGQIVAALKAVRYQGCRRRTRATSCST